MKASRLARIKSLRYASITEIVVKIYNPEPLQNIMAKGWSRESKRHSLAARGVRTSKHSTEMPSMHAKHKYQVMGYTHYKTGKTEFKILVDDTNFLTGAKGGELTFYSERDAEDFLSGVHSVYRKMPLKTHKKKSDFTVYFFWHERGKPHQKTFSSLREALHDPSVKSAIAHNKQVKVGGKQGYRLHTDKAGKYMKV